LNVGRRKFKEMKGSQQVSDSVEESKMQMQREFESSVRFIDSFVKTVLRE
jgi:hypothetical protein